MANGLLHKLGIEVPIVLAPMAGSVGPAAVAAVSNAGGLGLVPNWFGEPSELPVAIQEARKLTERPFGVNLNLQFPQEERLAICIGEGVRILSLFWGQSERMVRRAHAAGMTVLQTVGSAEQARRAVDIGADVIVAQGWEAGGHVWGTVATMALLPAVVDAVGQVPVIAAGGIADGRGLAAAMALGASGAWIGTRFLLAEEAIAVNIDRDAIAAAAESDTVIGKDSAADWRDSPMRWIGRSADRWKPDYGSYADIQLAGQSVGLVRRVQPAAEIVAEIWREAQATIQTLAQRAV